VLGYADHDEAGVEGAVEDGGIEISPPAVDGGVDGAFDAKASSEPVDGEAISFREAVSIS
jgi:hypothetical protein